LIEMSAGIFRFSRRRHAHLLQRRHALRSHRHALHGQPDQ
jgi:hypothetical protein